MSLSIFLPNLRIFIQDHATMQLDVLPSMSRVKYVQGLRYEVRVLCDAMA